jgi:peroxiredoxin
VVYGLVPFSVAPTTDETVLLFMEQAGATFPVMWDDDDTYSQYDAVGSTAPFPLDVIIDKTGTIRSLDTHYDPEQVQQLIEELLAE